MDDINVNTKHVILAKVAERAGRFDEMREFMKERAETGKPLDMEERDLLSIAFKGCVDGRRSAARIADVVFAQEKSAKHFDNASLSRSYRSRLESEIQGVCKELMDVIVKLQPKAESGEPTIFYLKMKGDYNRYLAEMQDAAALEEGKKAYQEAMAEADRHLLNTHPVRLGLSLNWAVFQNEVLCDCQGAVRTAQIALSGAMQSLEGMPDEAFQDAWPSLQMLQDNLKLWSTAAAQSAVEEEEEY